MAEAEIRQVQQNSDIANYAIWMRIALFLICLFIYY